MNSSYFAEKKPLTIREIENTFKDIINETKSKSHPDLFWDQF